ncbi:TonB-dependent receptor [Alteromonas sp. KUL17]|uniref:TonB-dependent receptor n=1 Tax=Alteromonas sp. KUL17 TaxID=2480796 RepID=UPI001037BCC8|nr:TonB-dependent receptor [Alteromonas sp. KUL17]TAP31126.1 TonB-dependent receptor [Alteromonas sp. KUL17]GEA01254.1 TonB-dependent receptor [Alteromonas sp. KUL17]
MHIIAKALLITIVILLFTSSANAETVSDEQFVSIPEGTLVTALSSLGEQYRQSVIADSQAISQFNVAPLNGEYTFAEALSLLVDGLPLEVRFVGDGAVIKLRAAKLSAQTEQETAEKQSRIEKVLVVGERLSSVTKTPTQAMKNALEAQLASRKQTPSFLSTANFQSLNASSANTLADAFGFLSGLTVARDFGEGLNVSVKGLGPDYQSTQLNGHPLAVNENVRDSGQSGRSFRFDVLPAQHVERIDVVKNPTASVVEGGVGSTILVQSLRPLTIGERVSKVSAGATLTEHSEKIRANFNTLQNWLSSDKSWGVLLSANHNAREIRQDHFHTWNWEPNGNSYLLDGIDGGVLIPSNRMAITVEREKRDTESFSVSTQWRPNTSMIFSADHFYSSLTSQYVEQRWLARLDTKGATVDSIVVQNNSLVGGQFSNIVVKAALDSSEQRHINQTSIVELQVDTQGWFADMSLAKTSALSYTSQPIRRTRFQSEPLTFSFAKLAGKKATPYIDFAASPVFENSSPEHVSARNIKVNDEGHSLRFALTKPMRGMIHEVSFGLDWREQSRRYSRQDMKVSGDVLVSHSPAMAYLEDISVNNFLNRQITGDVPRLWLIPNYSAQQAFASSLVFGSPSLQDRTRSYGVDEYVFGSRISANVILDNGWSGNIGLRWQHWQNEVSGLNIRNNMTALAMHQFDNAKSEWLPSLSIKKIFSPRLLLKASYGESITLPSYADVQPGLSLNTTEGVRLATGGNPNLSPTTSKQFDAGWLWSPKNIAMYVGVFHRELHDYIGSIPQTAHIDGKHYQLSRPENLDTFSLNGVELDFQYLGPSGGGLQLNGVVLDDHQQALEAVARWHYKVQLFYEREAFATRLAFDVQQSHLFTRSVTDVPDTYIGRQSFLSAQVNYAVSDNIVLSVSGRNLLDEPVRFYFRQNQGNTLKEMEYIGRSFTFSVAVTL